MKKIGKQVHRAPKDLQKMITSGKDVKAAWSDITPLARNEWICWVLSAKKAETRKNKIDLAKKQLLAGKRRPCCWPGCPHRRPSAAKWFNNSKKDK